MTFSNADYDIEEVNIGEGETSGAREKEGLSKEIGTKVEVILTGRDTNEKDEGGSIWPLMVVLVECDAIVETPRWIKELQS